MRCCAMGRSSSSPKPGKPRDRRPNPAPKRSDALGREQTTAPILLHAANQWLTAISTEPPCIQLTPSSAERARRERNRRKAVIRPRIHEPSGRSRVSPPAALPRPFPDLLRRHCSHDCHLGIHWGLCYFWRGNFAVIAGATREENKRRCSRSRSSLPSSVYSPSSPCCCDCYSGASGGNTD